MTLEHTSIAFDRVGSLPVPVDADAPTIYLVSWGSNEGKIKVSSSEGPEYRWQPTYSFTPMTDPKTLKWDNWSATGWEDCEIGEIIIQALYSDGRRFTWKAELVHDGDPRYSFWGAHVDEPTFYSPEKANA